MKKNSLKKPKRKIVPLRYQKNSSRSNNTSLSQLLSIGAYKKRINDLVRNNRNLAVALQESKCEIAHQGDLLKECAKGSNQIKVARYKLNEMAKTITKLVTDLHEVVECLDVDLVVDNLLRKDGSHDRMKIKAPAVDCIEEERSLLSPGNGERSKSSDILPSLTPDKIASSKTSDSEEMREIECSTSELTTNLAAIPDMPPVLFIDDSKEKQAERKSSRKSKSSKKYGANHISLTPELDIDFACTTHKRTSSRRLTQLFSPALNSKKSYLDQASLEYDTPKRSLIPSTLVAQRKLSGDLMDYDNDSVENERQKISFVNTKDRGSKNANRSMSEIQLSAVNITDNNVDLDKPSDISPLTVPVKDTVKVISNNVCDEPNLTLLLCESMELTDVIHPVPQIITSSVTTAVIHPMPQIIPKSLLTDVIRPLSGSSDIEPREEKMGKCNKSLGKKDEEDKHSESSEFCIDKCIAEIEKGNQDSINSDGDDVFKNNELLEPICESPNKNLSGSPIAKRSSRKRKNIRYIEFSSSESESDHTPSKLAGNKKHRVERDTVIFKPKSSKKTLNTSVCIESAKKSTLTDEGINKLSLKDAFSVFDLDVSNSKMPAKKSRPKCKAKSSQSKEIVKPLSQNCNITKLKGADYKFTKNDKLTDEVKENQQLQNFKSLEANAGVLKDTILKKHQPDNCLDNKDSEPRIENIEGLCFTEDKGLSPTDFVSKEISFKSPGTRKVSFASTDLVCNFRKMSLSKTIANNKKIHRTSKSIFKNNELFNLQSPETMPLETKDLSPNGIPVAFTGVQELLNFSDDTELYTFTLPPTAASIDQQPSTKVVSSNFSPKKLHYNHKEQNSTKSRLTLKNKLGKLSLRGNKTTEKELLAMVSDKTDEDVDIKSGKEIRDLGKKEQPLVKDKTDLYKDSGPLKENKKSNSQIASKIDEDIDSKSVGENTKSQTNVSNEVDENSKYKILKGTKNCEEKSKTCISDKIKEGVDSKNPRKRTNSQKKVQPHISGKVDDSENPRENMNLEVKSHLLISNKTGENAESKSLKETKKSLTKPQPCFSDKINEGLSSESLKKSTNSPKKVHPHISDKVENSEYLGKKINLEEKSQSHISNEMPENAKSKTLKETKISQQKSKPPVSNKTNEDVDSKTLKKSTNSQKKVQHHIPDNVDEDVDSQSLKRNKQSQRKALTNVPGKNGEDIDSILKCSESSVKSKNKSPCKKVSQDHLKENTMHTNFQVLEVVQTETQIKSKISKQTYLPTLDDLSIHITDDDIKDYKTKAAHKRDNSSQKVKLFQPSFEKTSRKSIYNRKLVESSPVLKDVVNLKESTGNRDSGRRRKVISYKEPTLNKKLRRT